jgi:NifU-like protein involved in Fe-S cluster formation
MIAASKALTDHCRGYTTSETTNIREENEQLESKTDELRIDVDEKIKAKFRETNIECDENSWF